MFLRHHPLDWAQKDSGPTTTTKTTKKEEKLTPKQIKEGAELTRLLTKQLTGIGLLKPTATKDKKPTPPSWRWMQTPEGEQVPYVEKGKQPERSVLNIAEEQLDEDQPGPLVEGVLGTLRKLKANNRRAGSRIR